MKSLIPILAACSLLTAGCSSTRYTNPDDVETFNAKFGRTDKQEFAASMVESLLESPALSYLADPVKGDDQRIVMVMGGVINRTSEHIDTEIITDSIRTSLLQSGRFRFVAGSLGQDEIAEQIRFQQGSGAVDPQWAKAYGEQLGAEAVLYGALRGIDKKKGRSGESLGTKRKDVYYAFVLNCVNVRTGELLWSNEKELSKAERIGLFGS